MRSEISERKLEKKRQKSLTNQWICRTLETVLFRAIISSKTVRCCALPRYDRTSKQYRIFASKSIQFCRSCWHCYDWAWPWKSTVANGTHDTRDVCTGPLRLHWSVCLWDNRLKVFSFQDPVATTMITHAVTLCHWCNEPNCTSSMTGDAPPRFLHSWCTVWLVWAWRTWSGLYFV